MELTQTPLAQGGKAGTTAKRPNSFLYRYLPATPGDLHNGTLQALQVLNGTTPITYESEEAIDAPDQLALDTYGVILSTRWVTVHDTAVDGTAPFNANEVAKAAHATPSSDPRTVSSGRPPVHRVLLRRERRHERDEPRERRSGHRPGRCRRWGSIMRLWQPSPTSDTGANGT